MKNYHAIGPDHPQGAYSRQNPWKFCSDITPSRINKKWGYETILKRDPYTIKVMTILPQTKVSVHFHRSKEESFILISGQLNIDIINLATGESETIFLKEIGDCITLAPDVPHSFYCPEGQIYDTIFLECSTKDNSSDNYRFFPSSGPEDNNIR